MKNLKNTLVAVGLAAVLGVGAVTANAGSLESDGTAKTTKVQCTVESEGFLQGLAGIVNELTGITIFDTPCKTDNEILMDKLTLR